MAKFLYEGTDASGKKVSGELEAKDKVAVFNQLRAKKITPVASKIRPKGTGMNAEININIPGLGAKVKGKDVVIFTRQFSTMIDAGLSIVQALDILAKQADNPALKKTLFKVKEVIESGGTLAEGLQTNKKVFDDLYCNMIDAGEKGGILQTILERLAIHQEKAMKLKREVKTALIYPAVVISAAVIVTSILMLFVIPTFAEMFKDFGSSLPLPTQIVIAISDFFLQWWYLIFGTMGGIVYSLLYSLKVPRGQEILHPIALRLPVFGGIIKKVAVARFTRTLGTMLSSGVPVLEALDICSRTAGNKVVEKEILRARIGIAEGKRLAEPLHNSSVFPQMAVSMIGVGDETGALDAMLNKLADFYEDEVNNAVGAMKQLIEPVMILGLGSLIGGLVVAMYLPIFKIASVVG